MTRGLTSWYDAAHHRIESKKEGSLARTYEDYGDRNSGFYRIFCGD